MIGSLNGTKVRSATRGDVVAFEADSYHPVAVRMDSVQGRALARSHDLVLALSDTAP